MGVEIRHGGLGGQPEVLPLQVLSPWSLMEEGCGPWRDGTRTRRAGVTRSEYGRCTWRSTWNRVQKLPGGCFTNIDCPTGQWTIIRCYLSITEWSVGRSITVCVTTPELGPETVQKVPGTRSGRWLDQGLEQGPEGAWIRAWNRVRKVPG